MMTSMWAIWTIAVAFIVPRPQHEQRQELEHRYLQTMIVDELV